MLSNKSRKVLLIVEDDEFIQDLIKRYLSSLNVELFSAYDGVQGVKKYEELMKIGKRPSLVIMDINLPFKDGIKATKEILSIDPDAIIYGFTAFYGTEKARELIDAGAKKVIPRTIGFEGFTSIIREALKEEIVASMP